jgi:hypothetical protein
MSDNVDKAITSIKELITALPASERREFASKISSVFAAGELTTVGDNAVSAAGERRPITLIQAAARFPHRVNLIKQLQSRARSLGYDLKDNEPINVFELDRALAGKNIDQRFALKTDMRALGLL